METTLPKLATLEQAKQLGLLEEEFEQIKTILGRTPNFTEMSIFSVMWSEHCSYKNSITWLKKLPRKGKHLLVEAGEENAGLVDIGDGLACAFKIESHNHPSAIEPYQGAATGVGGIHRDIFTMGARPIAALNSLRFGHLSNPKNQHLIKGVVKGIGDYGNCFGVPTVAGEVFFDDCFTINPLVNAMSVGICEADQTVSAISEGVGNPVFIVGSATGKDGIHGATFASGDITEDSADDLPAVQVGDPFQEKLLLEASLEAIKTGAIVGMQDMGAAGITCSSSEMSEKGGHGMVIDLDKVPTRQTDMKDWEILLSESQERMLLVVEKGKEQAILDVFEKWDLNCTQIGEVTEGDRIHFHHRGNLVADVPAESLCLGGGAPIYTRETKVPGYQTDVKAFDLNSIADCEDLKAAAKQLAVNLNIASKRWVYQQYDSMVGLPNRSTNVKSDAAVIRVPDSKKSLVVTVDCNSRYVYSTPRRGASIAVAECARNIRCSGGIPVAITNCLNFGNPYNPEVYWQFTEAIQGMGDACTTFETPVTGGNVSFYNQSSDEGPVFPTPTIGMLGIMESPENRMGMGFVKEGDFIYQLGEDCEELNSSEYLYAVLGVAHSPAPSLDLQKELAIHENITELIHSKAINSAHDLSEGGLFIALLESCLQNGLGCNLEIDGGKVKRWDCKMFGESQGRILVSVSPEKASAFEAACNVPFEKVGTVGGQDFVFNGENWGAVNEWSKQYDEALEAYLV